jgi:hypothetical protein
VARIYPQQLRLGGVGTVVVGGGEWQLNGDLEEIVLWRWRLPEKTEENNETPVRWLVSWPKIQTHHLSDTVIEHQTLRQTTRYILAEDLKHSRRLRQTQSSSGLWHISVCPEDVECVFLRDYGTYKQTTRRHKQEHNLMF